MMHRVPDIDSIDSVVRAAGRRGAGAPPAEARLRRTRAAGRRGAGAPPAEARLRRTRAAGRRGAGAPPAEAREQSKERLRGEHEVGDEAHPTERAASAA